MASKSCRLEDTSGQVLRGKRITDIEWESQRKRLVELYLDKDASRKEIISIMAQNHDFMITETQLKRRFQSWGVKRNIPHHDMTAILSVKAKHEATGEKVRIQYKNHDICPERIERAFKRRKYLLSCSQSIPPYIRYSIQSQRSPRTHALTSGGSHANAVFGSKHDLTPHAGTGDIFSVAGAPIRTHDLPVTTVRSGARFGTVPRSIAPHQPVEDVQNSTLSQRSDYGETLRQPSFDFEDDFDDQTAAGPSIWTPDFEDSICIDSPPNIETPYGVTDPNPDVFRPPDPPNSLSFDLSASSLQGIGSQCSLQGLAREDGPLRSPESAHPIALDPSIFEGTNPEEVVLPLQILKICFPAHWPRDSLGEYVGSASPFANLFNSMQLSLEIEDLLCQCFELSASIIRKRQAENKRRANGVAYFLGSPEASTQHSRLQSGESIGQNNRMKEEFEGKVTHHLMWAASKGTIKLRLSSTVKSHFDLQLKPQSIQVSFMPRDHERTTGVTINFRGLQDPHLGNALSRRIKTINVVPKDSKVIQCVRRNDLRSLQMLFDQREASPLDVDPQGFSLLSHAMYHGCSEVYLLLLQGGASTQECDRFGPTVDIVWAIWSTFAGFNSQRLPASCYLPGAVVDFDQLVSMTDAALSYGCDIEDTAGYMPGVANALFEIVRWCPLKEPHLAVPEKAINYLVKVGYDLEKRNSEGLTPLLHAASSYRPQIIQCLRTYINRGADINAVDVSGRGALHRALAVPHCFDNWQNLRLTDKILFDFLSYYYVPMFIYDTEQVGYATDYDDIGLDPKPLENELLAEGLIRRGKVCLGKCQSSPMHRVSIKANTARLRLDWTVPSDACQCGIDFDELAAKPTAYGDPSVPDGPEYDYIICKDFHGAEHFIKHPIKVLKTRLRFKLLTLLRANCDPNVRDKDRASPSDYARRDRLWPQWYWALKNAGFSYQPESDRWVRASVS